jgi:hypothetical protein
MAPPNQGVRIDELEDSLKKLTAFVNDLHLQLSNFVTEVKLAMPGYAETARKVTEMDKTISLLHKELDGLTALKGQPEALVGLKGALDLLGKDVSELVKWRDETKKASDEKMKMAWMIIPPLLAAGLTGAINFALFMIFKKQ